MTDSSHKSLPSVTVVCSTCDTRLKIRLNELARRVACPVCAGKIFVPGRGDVMSDSLDSGDDEPGEYQLATPLASRNLSAEELAPVPPVFPPPASSYFDERAKVRTESADPSPRWTFFSGVFGFAWQTGTLPRWIYLALGGTLVATVATFTSSIAASVAGPGGMVLAFFALPLIWLSIWTGSYAAACYMQIVQETSAGIMRINEWPEPNWREWAVQLMYVGYLALIAGTFGYGVGLMARNLGGSLAGGVLGTVFLLFPFLLLSSLEANSVLIPFSMPVLTSSVRHIPAWLIYYLLSIAILGVAAGMIWAAALLSPLLRMLVSGPVFATGVLIHARLLGRLAWALNRQK